MTRRAGSVHVATTRRRYKDKVYETHLLRRTYREGGKVKHVTLGNISHLPPDLIDLIRRRLRGDTTAGDGDRILRSFPHGHVAAVLGTLRNLGFDGVIASRSSVERSRVLAMIVALILGQQSPAAIARGLCGETATSSLGLELGIDFVDEEALDEATSWLFRRRTRIENKLAKRNLGRNAQLFLFSAGSCAGFEMTDLGEANAGRNDARPQVVYGLLCNTEGVPVAVEDFEIDGRNAAPAGPLERIRRRYDLDRLALVGDRDIVTPERIACGLRDTGWIEWTTTLAADEIRRLAEVHDIEGALRRGRGLTEIHSTEHPGERLIVRRDPVVAQEQAYKSAELLETAEKQLTVISAATKRANRPLKGRERIAERVKRVIARSGMGKYYRLEITDTNFDYRLDRERVAFDAGLDGLSVVHTSLSRRILDAKSVWRVYGNLAVAGRAVGDFDRPNRTIRPMIRRHHLTKRSRAGLFLRMLAFHVESHMRGRLRSVLVDDETDSGSEVLDRETPARSFAMLLADLATLTRNRVGSGGAESYVLTQPTTSQRRILELLKVSPAS